MSYLDSSKAPLAQISGKVLGELAQPGFCERCFWIKIKMRHQFPYAIFPGIFSSIDSFTKRTVHAFFDEHKTIPAFLSQLGQIEGYINPPHHTTFRYHDTKSKILLTGEADGIFSLTDGSLLIVDYKTARYTDGQDAKLPTYSVQLNCYALIAEHLGLGEVSGLAVIYMEPTTDSKEGMAQFCNPDGLHMQFYTKIIRIDLDLDKINHLLEQAAQIFTKPAIELCPRAGCENCEKTERFLKLLNTQDNLCETIS